MGHSLGMTDKEILKEFFYGKYVSEITIYYHNQYAYEQLVISLVNMFGKEFVIEQTGSNRIKFIQLDSPIKVSVENEMIF
ncbi:unknown [Blautia sp. CAG:237]|nr:unknown [Blautia sp. CAG:237]